MEAPLANSGKKYRKPEKGYSRERHKAMAAVAVEEAMVSDTLDFEPGSISELMMAESTHAEMTEAHRDLEALGAEYGTPAPARNGTHTPAAAAAEAATATTTNDTGREPTFAQRMIDRLFGMLRRSR